MKSIQTSARTLAALLLAAAIAVPAAAQEPAHESRPHHLSAVIGGTHIPKADETGFTLGVDYECRLSQALGLGFVGEHAFGPIDSTTLLTVADIHVAGGLAIQTGPGVEFLHGDSFFVTRLGALYELEVGEDFTVSPQLHYDFSTHEDALVFAVAIGRVF